MKGARFAHSVIRPRNWSKMCKCMNPKPLARGMKLVDWRYACRDGQLS